MIPADRPDLLYVALKNILGTRGEILAAGPVWDPPMAAAWSRFCNDFGIKDRGQPEYGQLPPLLRAWIDAEAAAVENNRSAYGVAPPAPPSRGPTMSHLLPNPDTGSPVGTEDPATGNFVPTKIGKEGQPVGITHADHHQLKKALRAATEGPGPAPASEPGPRARADKWVEAAKQAQAAPETPEPGPRPAPRSAPGGIRRPGPSTIRTRQA